MARQRRTVRRRVRLSVYDLAAHLSIGRFAGSEGNSPDLSQQHSSCANGQKDKGAVWPTECHQDEASAKHNTVHDQPDQIRPPNTRIHTHLRPPIAEHLNGRHVRFADAGNCDTVTWAHAGFRSDAQRTSRLSLHSQ